MARYWNSARIAHSQEAQRYHEFKNLPKQSKQASILYPHLSEPNIQRAMREISAGEGRRAPGHRLLKDAERGYVSKLGGQAKR